MTTLRRILIVDDDPPSQRLLQVRVRAIGCQVTVASDGQEALAAIEQELPDLMLLDLEMPRMGGMELLRTLKQRGVDLPIIVVTAHGSIDAAVEAMKEGAYDFIPKPFDPKHLEIVVRKVLEREDLKRDIEILTEEADRRYRLIIGESRRMNDAVETVRKAAPSKASILLLGESGTGKEIFARAIHSWSERKDKPFIAINCVGLSKELLESELFGHEKGAFTGALLLKKGKMELAHGGTVFLDEIGDVVQELQTKLLRFLQEREFERVGGTKQIQVDVRIIAATNRDLATAISQGRFREDLFHRLNVIPVTLPPLRQRPEDIPALVDHFIDKFSKEAKKQFSGISQEALVSLTRYDWPGNVRELANVIERSVVLGSGPMLMPHHLPASILSSITEQKSDNLSYRESMEVHRRSLLLAAVDRAHGNRAAAARSLGLHEKYLLRLLKSLGIGG